MRRWRPRPVGVRLRTTLTATVVVAVVLGVGGVVMGSFIHRSLVRGIDEAGALRARDVGALVQANRLPATVPSSGEQASVVQVLDPRGHVVAASGNIEGEPPLASKSPIGGALRTTTVSDVPIGTNNERFRVSALSVPTARGTYVVYVATSLAGVDRTMATLWFALMVGLPALLAVVALVTWVSTGRTLRPVEAIRHRVAGIGGTDLAARVPQPLSRDEVARLARTMNQMLDRLEAASVAQRGFVADASHELRGPLATIRAQAEVALAHPESTDWSRTLIEVNDEARRLGDLVEDLLLLAHADERGLPRGADDVDLDELVLAEAARLHGSGAKKIAVEIHQPARVRGSALRLERALRNLGDNATRHAATQIRLDLRVDRGRARVTVVDDGPGIAPDDRARVFDRFTRLDAARDRPSGGNGLGLAISREIVRAHGGDVTITDPPAGGPGVALVIDLPLEASLAGAQDRTQEPSQVVSAQPQHASATVGAVNEIEAAASRLRRRRR
ncbi:MAG TPA: ATP-binding protein, partial [Acidothermaceae bacterium]|nr:ATP-binding protein [Acidothermaceae bacterium]